MKIPIYLSHATPHTKKSALFLQKITDVFSSRGIECVYITSSDIQTTDAINAIKGMIKNCCGLAAVAFERRLLMNAVNKNGADLPGAHTSYIIEVKQSTPYIQIETAIALAYDKPVLILKEYGLLEEGILEPCCAGIDGPYFDVDDDSFFESQTFIDAVDNFIRLIEKDYSDHT